MQQQQQVPSQGMQQQLQGMQPQPQGMQPQPHGMQPQPQGMQPQLLPQDMQPQLQGQQSQQVQMPHQFVSQQPGVTVVRQNAPGPGEYKLKGSGLLQLKGLSITQMVFGGLSIIFAITLIGIEVNGYSSRGSGEIAMIGYGIWIGLWFILVGGIGLGAVNSNTKCWIISAMVLNIINSCTFCVIMVSLSSFGLAIYRCENYNKYNICQSLPKTHTFLTMDSFLLLIGFAELVIAIWSAVLCCGAVCDCCMTGRTGHVLHYNATPMIQTHQMSMYPSVPATTFATGDQQILVQGQYFASGLPVQQQQQPLGAYMIAPQGPPSYYSTPQNPTTSDPAHQQAPPTAYPTKA